MAEPARFIVSLDCEGKWGMADHLQPYHHRLLTDEALAAAYEGLVEMFGRYAIPATFAFVMAFLLAPEERNRFSQQLVGDAGDQWLAAYREAVSSGRLDGWHQPRALDIVQSAGIHEIACHGFCHRPLGEDAASRAAADAELDAALEVASAKGLKLDTFVFPRNRPGHMETLRSHGFIGFRQRLSRPGGPVGRLLNLAEEFNVWAAPQHTSLVVSGLVPIPSGRFLNWRFGPRRGVPLGVTRARWRHQLRSATRTGDVVHLWLHPHNLITGPETAELLETILREVAAMRDRGEVSVLTQRDYCLQQLT